MLARELWDQGAEIDADRLHHERGDVAPLQPLLDAAQRLRRRVEGFAEIGLIGEWDP